jgi:hypothetical protein
MLANAKCIYPLDTWTVEKRPNGWYFSQSAYHRDKHEWRGPYSGERSVTLMIARELLKEIRKRPAGERARGRASPSAALAKVCCRRYFCLCCGVASGG